MSALFPNAEITGTDLSPVQPTEVPPNVHFLVDDATEEEWLWDSDHFDFMHIGHMTGAMPSFKRLLRQAFKHLKPGAYMECHELDPKPKCDDGTMPPEHPDGGYSEFALHDWVDLSIRSSRDTHPPRQFRIAHRIAQWMKDVGFVDVEQHVSKIPVNTWPQDEKLRTLGAWNESNWLAALSGWSYKPFLALGWSKPEIEVFLVDVRKSIQDRSVHAYMEFYVVTGRKPYPARQDLETYRVKVDPQCLRQVHDSNWLAHAIAHSMSFGRHAYRHALKPPATPTLDHLWISDDLLAATFRRFANGQRRHGSCVPGPLEARRRLAKRRNTALASIGGGPAEDIACLFGRNGREHMKWTDHPWQRAPFETQTLVDHSSGPYELPFSFSDQNPQPEPSEFHADPTPSDDPANADQATREEILEKFLDGKSWGIEDARDFTRRLRIDLHREPRYSQQIFKRLLARSDPNLTEAIAFLDDPFLNTRGSGNYVAAVEIFVRTKAKRGKRIAVLNAINRALELGLISTDEICLIITALPKIIVESNKTLGSWDQKALLKHYRAMWKAIGSCNILGYADLDMNIVDAWLGELLNTHSFRFAEEIIIETHDADRRSQWPSVLVQAWLETMDVDPETSLPFPDKIFSQLDVNSAADCVIRVTESLASSSTDRVSRNKLLARWRDCLSKAEVISTVAESQVWFDFPLPCVRTQIKHAPLSHSTQRQIVLRLWLLRTLGRSTGPMYKQSPRLTDRPICSLLNLYETVMQNTSGTFFPDLMQEIHDLDLPYNGLLLLALNKKGKTSITKTTRKTLEQLETNQLSLAQVWTIPSIHKGIQKLFHSSFDEMFRRMDLTNPTTVEEMLRVVRSGDSTSIWPILRLLNNNTPFKLSIHKAWQPIPHPDDKALIRYHPAPRTSQCPDPHAAVDLINQLAIALSCCKDLSPCQSFRMIHWLYGYLRRHGGPVDPVFVRAMYHAGVVRYRREGLRISATQYEYIIWIVGKFEGYEVIEQLTALPQIGESRSDRY
ncbi:hypothetical protein N7457_008149 [Penicillium paradoxum]|uniref:uncharacterized protein n=1 Tax=Penicillium paradoxum TaxID=176176 RepID=UPI0025472EA7|nr:uncharacterized protein N7457_008149 [Penicillium paradoxum]KAJ5773253.1 hypothetical protein N7457_008149 [Penicillium paradoxum]